MLGRQFGIMLTYINISHLSGFHCTTRLHARWQSCGHRTLGMSQMGSFSDFLSVRQPFPLCPRFQTYCYLAANDVQGQQETITSDRIDLDQSIVP